jgi:hypothetical protein
VVTVCAYGAKNVVRIRTVVRLVTYAVMTEHAQSQVSHAVVLVSVHQARNAVLMGNVLIRVNVAAIQNVHQVSSAVKVDVFRRVHVAMTSIVHQVSTAVMVNVFNVAVTQIVHQTRNAVTVNVFIKLTVALIQNVNQTRNAVLKGY